jgi:gag-polypeptide of LTR copia-type
VLGKVACPDVADDAMSTHNWVYNDTFAQLLINSNIANTERIYTNGCTSAHHMWTNLQSMHESKSHLILTTHLRTLMNTIATEDDNIPEHLTKLKHCWDQLSLFGDTNYRVSEFLFKRIIASSLPESWDQFTDQFVAGQLDFVDTDPRKHIDSQQFIGILKQEYERRQSRNPGAIRFSKQALFSQNGRRDNARPSLHSRITGTTYNQDPPSLFCKICERTNHTVVNCRFKGKPKCGQCGKFGHTTDKCWNNGGDRRQGNKGHAGRGPKKSGSQERSARSAPFAQGSAGRLRTFTSHMKAPESLSEGQSQ